MDLTIISKALSSDLILDEMCELVTPPTLNNISLFCSENRIELNNQHHDLLSKFGGSNLDIIRINGLDKIIVNEEYIEFASDDNGFIYKYNAVGQVFLDDTDGGAVSVIAPSIYDYFNHVLFGLNSSDVYGVEWQEELRVHGICSISS